MKIDDWLSRPADIFHRSAVTESLISIDVANSDSKIDTTKRDVLNTRKLVIIETSRKLMFNP